MRDSPEQQALLTNSQEMGFVDPAEIEAAAAFTQLQEGKRAEQRKRAARPGVKASPTTADLAFEAQHELQYLLPEVVNVSAGATGKAAQKGAKKLPANASPDVFDASLMGAPQKVLKSSEQGPSIGGLFQGMGLGSSDKQSQNLFESRFAEPPQQASWPQRCGFQTQPASMGPQGRRQ